MQVNFREYSDDVRKNDTVKFVDLNSEYNFKKNVSQYGKICIKEKKIFNCSKAMILRNYDH